MIRIGALMVGMILSSYWISSFVGNLKGRYDLITKQCFAGVLCFYGEMILLTAVLAAPMPANKARDRFVHCLVEPTEDGLRAIPRLPQGSHDVLAYGRGSALLRRHPSAPAAEAGEPCSILPLANWPLP